ncbi:MAG TPA: 16S rRNA (cytosine(1402)-N(4))-methyltransferase RsmH [Lentimicrobium sp.]|nr:16S rRNA (cytosine(1402)-N(4))-methyltransferase RsmH [Lentimicrobium sp.]
MYHKPVLLQETIDLLAIKPEGTYVDVTFGGGGHSKAILDRLTTGRLIAFDQDKDALKNTFNDSKFLLINQNFKFITNFLKFYKAIPVDGILADLGISSHQIDDGNRGFSIRLEGELDLRMDQSQTLSAKHIINTYNADDLKRVFKLYGELENAWQISQKIIAARVEKEITLTTELLDILKPFAERGRENKFFARVFQALRIEVNNEIGVLEEFLLQTANILKPGGRLVIISYHSLEDRLVKNYMRYGNLEGDIKKDFFGNVIAPFTPVIRKPIVPEESELTENPRSRSAKLRAAERRSDESR